MASQLVSKTPLNVDDVFSLCKEKGYTQHGEMFSGISNITIIIKLLIYKYLKLKK